MWCLYDEDFEVVGRCDSLNEARAAQSYLLCASERMVYLLLDENACMMAEHEQLKMEDFANG
jgi:hypothetical protein